MTAEKKAIDQPRAQTAEYLRFIEQFRPLHDDDEIMRKLGPGGFTITAGLIRMANREIGAPEIANAEVVRGPAVSRIFRLKTQWTIYIGNIDAVGEPYQKHDFGNLWLVDYRRSAQPGNDYVTFDTREEAESFRAAVVAAMQAGGQP